MIYLLCSDYSDLFCHFYLEKSNDSKNVVYVNRLRFRNSRLEIMEKDVSVVEPQRSTSFVMDYLNDYLNGQK